MNFKNALKQILNQKENNTSITENGAVGYKSTGHSLLDLNFQVASLRNASEKEITSLFMDAYYENPKFALLWLFYARDIRGGLGERNLFKVIFKHLLQTITYLPIKDLIEIIPEYGRFDDLLIILDTIHADTVMSYIKIQLGKDLFQMSKNQPVSLLAKWLPSINTSSKKSKFYGRIIAYGLGLSEKEYRKTLSSLRKYTDIVECKMSNRNFSEINYETVPSKANLIYKNAFLIHDKNRRETYLRQLVKGNVKINASVLFPHEIVQKYMSGYQVSSTDIVLEELWKSLPNTIENGQETIVVADGSGSMNVSVGQGHCTALTVANALAIYFSERLNDAFKNTYITFSCNPKLVDLEGKHSLREKLLTARKHCEVANTDIQKVFELILETACKNKLNQKSMPKNILIISDMEFDGCAENANTSIFKIIGEKYIRYGYQLPKLIFWNVNSRTNTIPVIKNQLGIALVSGFSVNIAKMVMSNELDPYKCLIQTLHTKRYEPIQNIWDQMSS